ncbi:MAG: hypothetical protein BJ554DRAFT_1250 [Olpidium bornovanus]|uniref:PH domain-containing protein n=1 Tax=Olpidium bornovanus TaxID=278681 RepID=A0A8H7ZSS8_9FUNG|nr:MAG: hypothetical protein BJ554DRAFT_1250 [Olpidium bornovanus]
MDKSQRLLVGLMFWQEYKLLHIINLKLAHAIDEVRLKNHPYALGIVTRARTYYMQAASRKELDEWLDVLWDVQARLLELRQSSAAELAGAGAAEERPVPTPGTGGKRCSADYGMLSAGTQTRGAQARPLAVKQTSRSHEGLVSDKPRPPDIYVGGGGRSPLRVQRSYHSATGVPCTESPGAYSSSGGQNEYTDSSEEEDNFLPDDIVGGDLGPTGSRPFDSVVPGAPTKTENNVIVKCGYLWKRGAKYNGWKKRWFVLRNQKLAYYKNEKVKRSATPIPPFPARPRGEPGLGFWRREAERC